MIILNAFIEVYAGMEKDFLAAAKPLIEDSRKESGNHFYQLYQNENEFVFVEYWQNQNALDMHKNSDHYQTFSEMAKLLFSKPLRIESYTK